MPMRARQQQQKATLKRKQPSPDSDDESSEPESLHGVHDGDDDDSDDMSDNEDNADAPKASRWEDEDEDVEAENSEDDSGDPESSLRKDLSSLPFGTLLKARAALSKRAASESSGAEEEDGDNGSAQSDEPASEPAKPAERKTIDKRSNKHAPVEVTSKRQVPRFRPIVEVKKVQSRDPRFNHLSGELQQDGFQSAYSFLPEMHVAELATLREDLTRARKLLLSSPRDLREEREQEVHQLERAVRSLEGIVQREHRQKVEHDALNAVKKSEKEKTKQGKGQWFMKNSEKKDLLLKARYDDLAASGKRGAVQKAIEKKQRKVAQKEKKSRPFAAPPKSGAGNRGASSSASNFPSRSEDRPNKRQKFT